MDYSLKLASPARQGMMRLNKKQLLYCRFLRVLETSVLEHKLAEGTSWAPFARSYTSKGKEHFHACYRSLHKTSYFRHSTHSTVKGKVSARAPGWGEALPSRRTDKRQFWRKYSPRSCSTWLQITTQLRGSPHLSGDHKPHLQNVHKLLLETPSLPLNNAVDPRSSDSHYPGASYSIKQCVFGDEVVTRSRGGLGMLD